MMDGHIWFVGWYDGGDYHEIKITQKEVDNCATAGCGLNSILYYIGGKYGDEALYNMIYLQSIEPCGTNGIFRMCVTDPIKVHPEFQNGGIYLVDCNRTLICGNGDELYMRLVKEKGDIT